MRTRHNPSKKISSWISSKLYATFEEKNNNLLVSTLSYYSAVSKHPFCNIWEFVASEQKKQSESKSGTSIQQNKYSMKFGAIYFQQWDTKFTPQIDYIFILIHVELYCLLRKNILATEINFQSTMKNIMTFTELMYDLSITYVLVSLLWSGNLKRLGYLQPFWPLA